MPDQADIAKQLVGRFIERRDAKAIQTKTGAYMPVRTDMRDNTSELVPWRLSDVIDHLEGTHTYGHYLVSLEGTCRVIVFDIDLRAKAKPELEEEPITFKGEEIDPRAVWVAGPSECKTDLAHQLRVMAEGLARRSQKVLGAPVMVSYSGSKGMHTYVCLDRGTPAADAREAARLVFEDLGVIVQDKGKNFYKHDTAFKALSIEVFPKQDEIKSEGFGNLIRLPLGVNQKTGGKGFFMDLSTQAFRVDDPLTALEKGSLR